MKGLTDFHKLVEFDGIWIDMNEASNFCNGECESQKTLRLTSKMDPEFTQYVPGGRDPRTKCISKSAYHYNQKTNSLDTTFKEQNLHSTFGYMEGRATSE